MRCAFRLLDTKCIYTRQRLLFWHLLQFIPAECPYHSRHALIDYQKLSCKPCGSKPIARHIPMLRLIFSLSVLVTISGCMSIPFTTLFKLSSFTREDLIHLRPEIVGAAIELPEQVKLDEDSVELRVEIHFADSSTDAKPILESHSALAVRDKGRLVTAQLPRADNGRRWYLLYMEPDQLSTFRQFQDSFSRLLAIHGESLVFRIYVFNDFIDRHTLEAPFDISIWLNLDKPEDWFPLTENFTIDPADFPIPDEPLTTVHEST